MASQERETRYSRVHGLLVLQVVPSPPPPDPQVTRALKDVLTRKT
jgi:hypothetical protein